MDTDTRSSKYNILHERYSSFEAAALPTRSRLDQPESIVCPGKHRIPRWLAKYKQGMGMTSEDDARLPADDININVSHIPHLFSSHWAYFLGNNKTPPRINEAEDSFNKSVLNSARGEGWIEPKPDEGLRLWLRYIGSEPSPLIT